MAPQEATSTPIFDELLREMSEGRRPPVPTVEQHETTPAPSPAPRRRHRSE